jgi:RNA polymerase sigma-70 factor (ECF subfamily)
VSLSPDHESELIARARGGDAAAFSRLAEAHAERLWREAVSWCGDAHLAEDLVQEALLETWRGFSRYEPARCRLSTWLHAILYHRHLKAVRRAVTRLPSAAALDSREPAHAPTEAPVDFRTPADALLGREEAERVRAAVAALPETHRTVIQLRFFADASLEEIAAALGCSLGTVKSRLHYGLEKLRELPLFVNPEAATRE